MAKLQACENIELRPRYSYFQFIKLIRKALVVVADVGSNQEECYDLGKPCIIMRSASERPEGIGKNAVIRNYQQDKILEVIDNPAAFEIIPDGLDISPTGIIVEYLSR